MDVGLELFLVLAGVVFSAFYPRIDPFFGGVSGGYRINTTNSTSRSISALKIAQNKKFLLRLCIKMFPLYFLTDRLIRPTILTKFIVRYNSFTGILKSDETGVEKEEFLKF